MKKGINSEKRLLPRFGRGTVTVHGPVCPLALPASSSLLCRPVMASSGTGAGAAACDGRAVSNGAHAMTSTGAPASTSSLTHAADPNAMATTSGVMFASSTACRHAVKLATTRLRGQC